jgi:DNA-binding MarR family transcriptional regulator
MTSKISDPRTHRRLTAAVKESMRGLSAQLTLLNQRVGAGLELREGDLGTLDLIARLGPLSPSALARSAHLHPATMTGVLDRLERGGWIRRERDPADRRGVLVVAARERSAEIFARYAGMNASMDALCDGLTADELRVVADFLDRATAAGRDAVADLS